MTLEDLRSIAAYILTKLGCLNPFRISRIIAYAELMYMKEHGDRLTDLVYKGFDNVFYIEGLKEAIDNECFVKVEGDPSKGVHGCIKYTCEPPVIDEVTRKYLEKAIEEIRSLSDRELNDLVVKNDLLKKIMLPMK